MFRRHILMSIILLPALSTVASAQPNPSSSYAPDSSLVRMIAANPDRKITLHLYSGEKLTGTVSAVEGGVEIKTNKSRSLTETEKVTRFLRWEQIQKIEVAEKRSPVDRAVVIGSWITCVAAVVLVAVLFLGGY